MTKQKCPECGEDEFFINREQGETICKQCGFVVEDNMVTFGRERFADQESMEKLSRTGAPWDPRISNNLSTNIGNNQDLRKLDSRQQMLFRRIRKKNNWTSSSLESNFNKNLANLRLLANSLSIPERVEKEAAQLYRQFAQHGFTRARSCEYIVVASIYAACKMHALPKSLKEISDVANIDKKIIAKNYKYLSKKLGLKMTLSNPIDFLGKFNSELGLSPKVQSRAVELIELADKKGLTNGKSPLSTAASSLYISALILNEKVTQKNVADTAKITEVTLRNRCKEMINGLKIKSKLKKKIKC